MLGFAMYLSKNKFVSWRPFRSKTASHTQKLCLDKCYG